MTAVRRFAAVLALSLALSASAGCVAAAVAVGAAAAYGAVKYTDNEAYQDFHASLEATWEATVASMREQGYTVSDLTRPGTVDGRISAGDATVVVESHPDGYTRVRVRVGTFSTDDHRRRAALLLEGVDKRID